MPSIKDLPLWAKSLVAPAVMLAAMLAMAGTAFVNLAQQEADVAALNGVAFEGLRAAMSTTAAAADFQADLYHLTSTAANETDKSKIKAISERLAGRLGAIAPEMKTVPAVADGFARYDNAARQVLEITVLDAAYGVMMMGDAEQSFAQLRGALAETSRQAEQRRDIAAAGLATALAHMRLTFLALVSAGAAVSIAAALLIARAISRPTIRLTRTMAALAGGSVDVEIPDQRRRDEIGAMAKAVQVFKETMIGARRLADEQAAAAQGERATHRSREALARDFEAASAGSPGRLLSAAREMEATAGTMLSTADQTDQRPPPWQPRPNRLANVQTVATAAEELAASVREISVQAAQSAKTAGRAVEDARHTDALVQTLMSGAQKIGEVVTIIHDIASQTNLPPLMFRISYHIRCLGRSLADFTRGIPMILWS